MRESGANKKSNNYSRLTSRLLNAVFYDLFPLLLAVKGALTLWSVLATTSA